MVAAGRFSHPSPGLHSYRPTSAALLSLVLPLLACFQPFGALPEASARLCAMTPTLGPPPPVLLATLCANFPLSLTGQRFWTFLVILSYHRCSMSTMPQLLVLA